jgi:hypothetical protein
VFSHIPLSHNTSYNLITFPHKATYHPITPPHTASHNSQRNTKSSYSPQNPFLRFARKPPNCEILSDIMLLHSLCVHCGFNGILSSAHLSSYRNPSTTTSIPIAISQPSPNAITYQKIPHITNIL